MLPDLAVCEGLIFHHGFRPWRIEHLPIRFAFGVRGLLIIYFDDVARFTVGQMHLVHLLFHVIEVRITCLRRILAVTRVKHLGSGTAAMDGTINLEAEQLVEALGSRCKLHEVVIIERPHFDIIQHLSMRRVEYDINSIGDTTVGQRLTIKDNGIAGVVYLASVFTPAPRVFRLEANFGADECAGVLE